MNETDLSHVRNMVSRGTNFRDGKTGKAYFSGYAYETLYDWDQYFEGIIQSRVSPDTSLIENGVTIFLDNQAPDGFIYRSVPRAGGGQGDEHVKPFLAQIALLTEKSDPELSFITPEYYEKLKKYLLYWLVKKSNDGLAVWDSAPHTGMDNQHERAGYWYDGFCAGVDLNSYIVRECRALAQIARIKGSVIDAAEFEKYANARRDAVLSLWDEQEGIFYDRDARCGEAIKVKYIGSFAVLWAGIATKAQADRLVKEHLLNPREFYRPFPFPAYAASEPGYTEGYLPGDLGCNWRANTWIPTNYYVMRGLLDYGYTDLAKEIARITYETVKRVGDREYYTSETSRGCGLDPFWGWSLLAYLMPDECE